MRSRTRGASRRPALLVALAFALAWPAGATAHEGGRPSRRVSSGKAAASHRPAPSWKHEHAGALFNASDARLGRQIRSPRFPSELAYEHALRDPAGSLQPAWLGSARLALDAQGRPLRKRGGFAITYRLETERGPRALRLAHPPSGAYDREDRQAWQARYATIEAHFRALLRGPGLPRALSRFSFEDRGIRVGDRLFPIMVMPWIEGRELHEWIGARARAGDTEALTRMADQFRATIELMADARIAHGDLHHSNVIITDDGRIRLVDYDAMFVPALAGRESAEAGHMNYGHPQHHFGARTPRDYGLRMDHFSSLVIYVSLRALAHDPSLWDRYHRGGNLIFRGHDLRDPGRSALFAELERSNSSSLKRLVRALREAAEGTPEAVPPLEEMLSR